jgi:sporulation protein YlmC with PRC-barrel domain
MPENLGHPERFLERDFHFGVAVTSADGKHIGTLRRIVVDRETFDVHSIIVKETRRFSGHYVAGTGLLEDDIAIPLQAVQSADTNSVLLSITATDARRKQPYLSYQYAPLSESDVARMAVASVSQTAYIPHLIEEAHKALQEIEINPGENVMLGETGRKLGSVKDVIMENGELVGVVVHPSGFFREDVLLQVRFIGRSDDLSLFAHLTEADLSHLRPFHPEA